MASVGIIIPRRLAARETAAREKVAEEAKRAELEEAVNVCPMTAIRLEG